MSQPSLLVVNQYYEPDLASTGRYAAGLCSALVKRGWRVRVVCGQPSYSRGLAAAAPAGEILDGVEVHRVSLSGIAGRDSIPRRFFGYGLFMVRAWRKAAQLVSAQRPDIVMTFHNPPFVGLIGRRISREFDVPFVYSPFDILPDVLKVAGWPLPKLALRAWDRVNAAIHDEADIVIVLDASMRRVLERKGVDPQKVRVMSLWALPDLSEEPRSEELRQEVGADGTDLLLLYAGNMGYMHSLESVLSAASRLEDRDVQFVFIGEGPERSQVEKRVASEGLNRVRVLGYQPEARFRTFVASADAAIVSIRPGAENLGMPSRALTFLSAGTPILAHTARHGALAELLDSTGAGWVVSNPVELARVISSVSDRPWSIQELRPVCQRVYQERFGRDRSVGALCEALEGVRERCLS